MITKDYRNFRLYYRTISKKTYHDNTNKIKKQIKGIFTLPRAIRTINVHRGNKVKIHKTNHLGYVPT